MPMGPIGLLIESIVWNGLAIDRGLNIWQRNEQPVYLLKMPYQDLKPQLHMMATRARTLAESRRHTSTRFI